MTTENKPDLWLKKLAPVTTKSRIQTGYVYKSHKETQRLDNVAYWVVTHPGITHSSVLGFDADGVATEPRTLRCEDLRKRKPIGHLPIQSLRIVEPTQ